MISPRLSRRIKVEACPEASDLAAQYPDAGEGKIGTGRSRPVLGRRRLILAAVLLPALLCFATSLFAAQKAVGKKPAAASANPLAPLPEGTASSVHAPFAAGDCSLCHQKEDPKAPGPLLKDVNDICLDCHEDQGRMTEREFSHPAAQESCSNCHNSHNAKHDKLLLKDVGSLCLGCHPNMQEVTFGAKVKHDAAIKDKACVNCHNPHGAAVEHLLISLPFDLCVTCHGKNNVVDHNGRKLTNFIKVLAENPEHHGPVEDKDCSACHNPHGGQYFRLLNKEYPSKFYSAYNPENYALCFECHEESAFEEPKTTTLTLFRDGDVNLHYLHVTKAQQGRTCRFCHEVHAAKQAHQVRDGVPYGSKGWVLKINYTPTDFGGTCTKTCHGTRSYRNRQADRVAGSKDAR